MSIKAFVGSAMIQLGTRHAPTSAAVVSPLISLLGFHIVCRFPANFLDGFFVKPFLKVSVSSLAFASNFDLARRLDHLFSGGVPPIPFTLGTGSCTGSVFFSLVGSSTS
jgi:hypothetical protein